MHTIRYALAALSCACIGAASASTVTLQLSNLSYAAYSLNPQGGSAAVGLQQDPYHAVADLLGTREQQHQESTWDHGDVVAGVWGASTRMSNAASARGGWNSNSGNVFYDIDADAYINDPLSQWYFAQAKLDTGATLTLTPNSALVVSGHLSGSSDLVDTDAKATFSALLSGGGESAVYERAFGTGAPLGAVNDFFTLTLFNKSDSELEFSWKVNADLTASRAVPAIPEPSFLAMALAGALVLSMRHAGGALRRQRIRVKYPAAPLQWPGHIAQNCGGSI